MSGPRDNKKADCHDYPGFIADRLAPSLIFFAVAFFFLKLIWYNGITYTQDVSDWVPIDVVVEDTHISWPNMLDDYQLSADFSATYQGVERDYRVYINSGTKGQMENIAEEHYPIGGTITAHINPDDPTEFVVREPTGYGPWIAGLIPGIGFLLIGLSVLLWGRSQTEIEASKAKINAM